MSFQDALETVSVWYESEVFGFQDGHGNNFMDLLSEAKRSGLRLALYLSEVPSKEEETKLQGIPPDRIAHGAFLLHSPYPRADALVPVVREHRIPMELCLTSNVKGQTVPSYDKHHFGLWYNLDHPSLLCTDNKAIFVTNLSLEYEIAAKTFNLTLQQIWELSNRSIHFIFAAEHIKSNLKEKWTQMKPEPTTAPPWVLGKAGSSPGKRLQGLEPSFSSTWGEATPSRLQSPQPDEQNAGRDKALRFVPTVEALSSPGILEVPHALSCKQETSVLVAGVDK
ncbi:adenosine deaminase-like protein A [Dendropsophus ebraccatus]|uniref:adenosine deaminase-like protein A n=1 Tax=Dendropsophus ebraccatus TaxID=150705 RepID=UPI00383140BD